MKPDFLVVIPVRYGSARLPGKPLIKIGGYPLLQHVYQAAVKSDATGVVIATDDARIEAAAQSFGARVVMTSASHRSGTDRIAEAVTRLQLADDCIIVNVQGDELGLPPELINQAAHGLAEHKAVSIASLYAPIQSMDELNNPNNVKVVIDNQGYALFFSRSPIPWKAPGADARDASYRHIGIYAYTCKFLKTYTGLPVSNLEQMEKLEQLRALYHGFRIYMEQAKAETGPAINTPEDIENEWGQNEWGQVFDLK